MAVSLRFLGQKAAQQCCNLSLPAGASPRVLGGKTPKTPKTPASALAFFEDFSAAKTPKTPANLAPPSFFGDVLSASPRTPAKQVSPSFFGDVLSASPRAVIAGHVSFNLPETACDKSPSSSASASLRSSLLPKLHPEASSGPTSARDAFLARRSRVAERGTGAEPASLSLVTPSGIFPTLLSREMRQSSTMGERSTATDVPRDTTAAAASACDAFRARRERVASRSTPAFGSEEQPKCFKADVDVQPAAPQADTKPLIRNAGPMLLGQRVPQAVEVQEVKEGPEGAREAFLARRRCIAERPLLATVQPAPMETSRAAPFPTLLRPEARCAAVADHKAELVKDDENAAATRACALFHARKQSLAARSAAFVI